MSFSTQVIAAFKRWLRWSHLVDVRVEELGVRLNAPDVFVPAERERERQRQRERQAA